MGSQYREPTSITKLWSAKHSRQVLGFKMLNFKSERKLKEEEKAKENKFEKCKTISKCLETKKGARNRQSNTKKKIIVSSILRVFIGIL